VVAGLSLLGAGAFVYRDDVRHAYVGTQRAGRVVVTLFLNINEYVYFVLILDRVTLTIDLAIESR